jgi:hypothetical protein
MFKLVIQPLRLSINHLATQELNKLLLPDLREELLIKDTLVDELSTRQSTRLRDCPFEKLKSKID